MFKYFCIPKVGNERCNHMFSIIKLYLKVCKIYIKEAKSGQNFQDKCLTFQKPTFCNIMKRRLHMFKLQKVGDFS